MTRSILPILLLLALNMTAQIDCPPDMEVHCNLLAIDFPVIEGDNGTYELRPGALIGDYDCSDRDIQLEYFLYNLTDNTQNSLPFCSQTLTVIPLSFSDIRWPEDMTIQSDDSASNILDNSSLTNGIFPELDNTCNLVYSYEDVILESPGLTKVIRKWTALDWCKAETIAHNQIIRIEATLPLAVTSCTGESISIENFDVLLNGVVVDHQSCLTQTVTNSGFLNCVAESLNMMSTDVLTLEINHQTDALHGVSTIDLVKIQRHVLGLEQLQDECSLWAADVSSSNGVNGLDMIELRKLILGIYTELPQAEPARYYKNGDIDSNLSFAGADFPLSSLQISRINKGNVGK